ncbi:PREDICTED: importin-7-like [Amphimedon queenslandica]|uniref:Importin N-terminal domain-containing protein n=1 Tax=Amphimedon queenslandica TaxID=400682 RepID=A0AAN0JFB3_AMPQE|nr:PREDICTED: importin-7-like [Amphimedon queenslandica]|eukprot:XP_019855725.1 PREDICTED: importin-7-like [Amphimedon queenslandica]
MDVQRIAQAFANTLDPSTRAEAETELEQALQSPGFTPCLLQIVMNNETPFGIRQSASIYLKNTVNKYWKVRDGEDGDPEQPYTIPEESKMILRQNIVEGIIQTPPLMSKQLCVCLETIVRQDNWNDIAQKIHSFLSSDNQQTWPGALLSLYQLSKKYKYKKAEDKINYVTIMKTLLPMLYNRMIDVLPHPTEFYVMIQHWILKIFYCTIHYQLPFQLIDESTLPGWMIVIQTIIDRPVPQEYEKEDEEERHETEWWKCKKWCLHILCSLFERFGSPGNVEASYNTFADYYMKTFNCSTTGVINTLLKQLEKHRTGVFLTARLKQLIFNYLNEAINHASSWKLIRPHFDGIFIDIIFPLLCYSNEDDQLWHDDPYEYIRMKFDIFEDLVSPVVAVQVFLSEACHKRKNILDPVMGYCIQILNEPAEKRDPRKKDGALNVIGTTAEVLMKKKTYKAQLEPMLVAHVFPEFSSPFGYMRARACWMIQYFSEISFTEESHLQYALQQVLSCLTQDQELPVKVEAAVALQSLIKNQELAEQVIKPFVKPIITELLQVIKNTDNDDLTEVLQEIIETYDDCIIDIAVELCSNLVTAFTELLESSGGEEEDGYKALTALGLISAVQSLVKSAFSKPELLKQMETVLIGTIASIFQNGIMDYYEEMLTLLDLFTCESVSPIMWQVLGLIYEAFTRDGFDYFSEMMGVIYNFIRVDPDNFISNQRHIEIVISMAKTVLTKESGEEPQTSACKLLEVLLLECRGKIDQFIPNILECPLERLTKKIQDPDLRYACILVVVAGIYSNCALVLELLEKTRFPNSQEPITAQFFTQWLTDCKNFEG